MKIFQLRWGESEVNVINENSIIMHERREKIRREYVYKLRLFLLNCNAFLLYILNTYEVTLPVLDFLTRRLLWY